MSWTPRLEQAYARLERRVVPGLRYSQARYESALERYLQPGVRWLDLGSGRRVLPPWRADAERELVGRPSVAVGIDPDAAALRDNRSLALRCRGTVGELPFADGSFDLVTANMVVEHLREPGRDLREIYRVLSDGGVLLFHTPNASAYPTLVARALPDAWKRWLAALLDGRDAEDVYPTYYRANGGLQIRAVAEAAGFAAAELTLFSTSSVFNRVLPLALVELLWVRALARPSLAGLRSNIIAVLRKGKTPADAVTQRLVCSLAHR